MRDLNEKFGWVNEDDIVIKKKKTKTLKELFDKIKSFLQKDLESKSEEDSGTRS